MKCLQDHLVEHFPECGFLSFWSDFSSPSHEQDLKSPDPSYPTPPVAEVLCGTALEPIMWFDPSRAALFLHTTGIEYHVSSSICSAYVADPFLDADIISRIEQSTRGQAENEIWHFLRNGRLTSSCFEKYCDIDVAHPLTVLFPSSWDIKQRKDL